MSDSNMDLDLALDAVDLLMTSCRQRDETAFTDEIKRANSLLLMSVISIKHFDQNSSQRQALRQDRRARGRGLNAGRGGNRDSFRSEFGVHDN